MTIWKKPFIFVETVAISKVSKKLANAFSIDVALMPIGAYEPEWFMKISHVSPEEAVQAYLDLNATHFYTNALRAFALADETPREDNNKASK